MTFSTLKRAAATALIAPSLIFAPSAFAATPQLAKAKLPGLTCQMTTPSGLGYTVLNAGKGEMPNADAKVKVNYKGNLKADGNQFDAGEGTEFKVGGVIAGFSQGLQMMQSGSKYRLCIPSKLGYGEAGTGPIPANADLVFEVELLSFTNPPPKPIIPLAERGCDKLTASGLGYAMTKAGAGKTPTDADMALVDFMTFDAKTGMVLQQQEWERIPLAKAAAVFGEALKLMQVGATYTFCQSSSNPEKPAVEPEINIRINLLDVRTAPFE